MREGTRERLDDLAARAGLGGVPSSALVWLAAVCVAIALWAAWRFWPRATEAAEPFAAPEAAVTAPAALASATAAVEAPHVFVHVVGAVRRPGVYELPAGSRVGEALELAGGVLGSGRADAINLARVLQDGEQVRVPTQEEAERAAASGAPAGGAGVAAGAAEPRASPGGRVDLNTADEALLDTLPGIGPATAQRIVQDRSANGPFRRVDDLLRVPGIGPKKLDALRDLVTAG